MKKASCVSSDLDDPCAIRRLSVLGLALCGIGKLCKYLKERV